MAEPKLVFVNRYFHPDHSATSQLLSDLAFHLAAQGVAVTVVTSAQSYDDPGVRLPPRERVKGVDIHRVWSTRNGRGRLLGRGFDYLSFYLSAAVALLRLLRRGDTVVAKTDPPLISVVAAAAARLRGAELVNWLQDLFPEVAIELGVRAVRPLSPLLVALRNFSLRAAACNVAIGRNMARRIAAQGIPPSGITVIHNWSCAEDLRPLPPAQVGLRAQWGLEGKFVVGYSGNMGRAHEFWTLLDAAQSLRPRRDIVFLFIGGGAQRARIEEDAVRLGLDNVVFKPYQPLSRLAESLCVPDVHLVSLQPALEGLIVPSKYYGIVAAGRAVICIGRRDGEIADLIEEAGCGTTVAPGEHALLTSAILALADDPARCAELGVRARRSYERRFHRSLALDDWTRMLAPGREVGAAMATSYVGHIKPE